MTAGRDGRRRQRRARWRRPTTPARPSACCPRASPSPSASGPSLFEKPRPRARRASGRRALRPIPPLPADELTRARKRRRHLCPGLLGRSRRSPSTRSATWPGSAAARSTMRWSQLGFGRTSTTSRSQDTPRNLMGMKDGTANIRAEDTEAMRALRLGRPGRARPGWMRGGSYMVTRRIRMLLEIWDRSSLEDQEQTIGRHKYSGAPLGRRATSSTRSTSTPKRNGRPLIPRRRPRPPRLRRGQRRRADPAPRLLVHRRGRREPRRARSRPLLHLLPARPGEAVRRDPAPPRLESDALNEYIKHVGSAVFAVPPGAARRRLRRRSPARLSALSISDCIARVFVRVP